MKDQFPERIIQFGTGRFSRAFVDYFIHHANEQGLFDGSVVCVQSTGVERARSLNKQNGRFNVWLRGFEDGETVDTLEMITSISRVLAAREEWDRVLECAHNPEIRTLISIVSELGLVLDTSDRIDASPPQSFAGKLTAFLFERAKAFGFSEDAGMVILSCELVENNGDVLKRLVLDLSRIWELDSTFVDWVDAANIFCNTIVDRIVTGTPSARDLAICNARLGYDDPMVTVAEPYRLWAIEGRETLRERIPFVDVDDRIVITEDIKPFRERKLRLLNGGHTLAAPLGILLGNETVLDHMQHRVTGPLVEELLREEIGPTVPVEEDTTGPFIDEILERWRNPFLNHKLRDIAWQSTSKMKYRVVPTILRYYDKFDRAPKRIAKGFAAYLVLTRPEHDLDDELLSIPREAWADAGRLGGSNGMDSRSIRRVVDLVCSNESLWGTDLSALEGFVDEVSSHTKRLLG